MPRIELTTPLLRVAVVIALLAATAMTGAGVAHAGPDRSGITIAAPGSPLPVALWRACPNGDRAAAEHRVVRTFERAEGHAIGRAMPSGSSDLVCGRIDYGYYHIVASHFTEWNQKSAITSENWRAVADYSIQEALRAPESVAYRANRNTFCYSRNIYLVNKVTGAIVTSFFPNVIVSGSDGRIITAWPSGTPCA